MIIYSDEIQDTTVAEFNFILEEEFFEPLKKLTTKKEKAAIKSREIMILLKKTFVISFVEILLWKKLFKRRLTFPKSGYLPKRIRALFL